MKHDKHRALEVIEFIQMLKLTDDFHGQPFVLPDWQHQIIWDVYGTVTDEGIRQYNYAYLEIPKKNGKTTAVAGLGVYHLTCDGPEGQIYCCAADRQQAELVYKAAVSMIGQNEELSEILKITDSKKEILNTLTGTRLKVLSAEAYTKHGINPTVVIFDELHAQPNRDLWDVMTFGAGAARKEPLWWVITTAGDDPDRRTIGWEIHEKAMKLLAGEIIDPSWYVKIFGAPDDADIYDEEVWKRANPGLGITFTIDTVRKEALAARNSEAAERLFRWLRLNQWVAVKRIGWLPLTLWDATANVNITKANLVGKRCYAGMDLSSTTDLTGLTLLFPPQTGLVHWYFFTEGWLPEDRMRQKQATDKVPYERWVADGYMHATPGDVVDYEFVEARIMQLFTQYKMTMLGTDQWNSRMLTQRLEKQTNKRLQIVEVLQTMAGMSPAMKEAERLMRAGQLAHEVNPAARWCFGNTVIATDGNENIKPMKNRSLDRIDLTVSLINAMALAVLYEQEVPKCPYSKERGIIVL